MVPRSVSLALSAAALCLAGSMTAAQVTPLTIDDIYSYEGWTRFNGSQAATMAWVPAGDPWLNDTEHLWPSDAAHSSAGAGEARGPWLRMDAVSGASTPLYTYELLERALTAAGVSPTEARNAARLRQANFNQARDALLITIGDDLYTFSISTGRADRVTNSPGPKLEATFSPDGRSVAFVKNNDLFVARLGAPGEKALTSDGSADILNGTLDWVYSEELYGRGNRRGYWWSPDSSAHCVSAIRRTRGPGIRVD